MNLIVDLILEGGETRGGLVGQTVVKAPAGELVEVLAGVRASLHRDQHLMGCLVAGPRVAHALRAVPLPDAGLVLKKKETQKIHS